MIQKFRFVFICLILTIIIISCGKNEDSNIIDEPKAEEESTEDPEENPMLSLEEERNNTLETLTSGDIKSWMFEKVILTNTNGSFDISQNFNALDDVISFSISSQSGKNVGNIEWRKENDINLNAASITEALLEFLVSSETSAFEFLDNSGVAISAQSLGINFELTSDEKLSGSIEVTDEITLDVILKEKNNSTIRPTEVLNFTPVFSFQSNGVDNQSPDMIGSFVSNSIYVALREDGVETPDGSDKPERIIRFDIETNEVDDLINLQSFTSDFVSKELVLFNNELKVIGAQRVNSYDLELNNDPIKSVDYSETSPYSSTFFTRYGSAVLDNSIFIIGGFLGNDFEYADRIFKFDLETEITSDLATLPQPSFGARSEILGNLLYTFGGTSQYYGSQARSSIIIYNINSEEFSSSQMNRPVNFTFTGRQNNLIFVGGRIDTYNETDILVDRDPFMGVYNTNTDEFIELSTNLSSPNLETIHAMTVFNNKIYVLFGDRTNIPRPEMVEWTVMSANIQ
jgi:hypothetical protein